MRIKQKDDINDIVFFKQYFINSTIKQGRKLYSNICTMIC